VAIYARSHEDGPTTVHTFSGVQRTLSESDYNPSSRRDAVRIAFWGECGHGWSLNIIQHKGFTLLEPTVVEEA
jgi:hypothetical protein